jgi:peptidoglycan/xylan/chitin deacetylase (PgdA/CDA1 family)
MRFSVFLLVGCWLFSACREETFNVVYIAKYPDDKKAALSFTFDDGCASCFSTIAPVFRDYGYPATFFVIPGRITDAEWKEWKVLSDEGFEIGNHSLSHPDLTTLDDEALDQEVNQSFDLITQHIGKSPLSFAQPGHITNEKVDQVIRQRHLFTRMKPGFCEWQGWVSATTKKDVLRHIDNAVLKNEWYVPAAHGVEDCWEPISPEFLKAVLDHVAQYEKYLAIETFGNIALYKTAYENTTLISSQASGSISVNLASELDPSLYNFPLTIVINNCSFPDGFVISQPNGTPVWYLKTGGTLHVKAPPGARFEIKW